MNFSADSNTLSQFNFQTPEQETDSDDSKREASGDRMDSETADFIQNSCVWYTLGGLLLAAILLLPVIAVLLRKRRIYMLSKAGCRKVFWQFMAMLHEAGFMQGYTGIEADFAQSMAENLPPVSLSEAKKVQEIVSQAAYGSRKPNEKDNQVVFNIYQKTADFINTSVSRRKKFVMRYIKKLL